MDSEAKKATGAEADAVERGGSAPYRQRNDVFRRIFKHLPESEHLVVDYSCALQRDILVHGRLYLSEGWICFHSNIFHWETLLTIQMKEITAVTKEKTARVIPNAIQVCTQNEKYFFSSLGARDRAFLMIFRLWQNSLLDKTLDSREFLQYVQQAYGSDSTLHSEGDEHAVGDEAEEASNSAPELSPRTPRTGETTRTALAPVTVRSPRSPDNGQPLQIAVSPRTPHTPNTPHTPHTADTPHTPHTPGSSRSARAAVTPSTPSSSAHAPHGTRTPDRAATPDVSMGSPRAPPTHLASTSPHGSRGDLSQVDGLAMSMLGRETTPEPQRRDYPSPELGPGTNPSTDDSDASEGTPAGDGVDRKPHTLPPGQVCIDREVCVGMEKLEKLLFSDSLFMRRFLLARKITDVVCKPWEQTKPGTEQRSLTYTINLNGGPFTPKSSTATEVQIMNKESSDWLVVVSEVATHDVPYSEYFFNRNHFLLQRLSSHTTRLRISWEVCFRKQPWGPVKALIDKSSSTGLAEYFALLDSELLREEASRHAQPHPTELRQRTQSRRRDVRGAGDGGATSNNVHHAAPRASHGDRGKAAGVGADTGISRLLFVVAVVLLMLVCLNAVLFYKLRALEHTAHRLSAWHALGTQESAAGSVDWDWLELHRGKVRRAEVQKWNEILRTSLAVLDKMKLWLAGLQKDFLMNNSSALHTQAP
ncbi:unnamed protein product [Lampetra fluviatilis]